jgi:RNA recognition motif-containing protein
MNMYVSNLGFHINDESLKALFAGYGEVTSAKVINDRETGKSRGFGFVEMPNDAEAEAAMQKINGKEVEGRAVSVSRAKPKSDSGGGGGFSRGGGGGSRGGGGNRW